MRTRIVRGIVMVGIVLALGGTVTSHRPGRAAAQDPCAGLIAPRLSIGGAARVVSVYGLSLKNQPATGAAGASELDLLSYGAVVSVLDGYRCNLGYVWWQVLLPNGTTGWAAEGDSATYFLEPYTVGLDVYRVLDGGARVARYFVTPDGAAALTASFPVAPLIATPGDGSWQEVEIGALQAALTNLEQNCPKQARGTLWEAPETHQNPLAVPLPPLDYDLYPAPDGSRLLLVRHLTLNVPRCNSALSELIGMGRVSLLAPDGTETILFPYPLHGSVPPSQDRYALSQPDAPAVYLDEVSWSPHGKYIAFVAAYRDLCSGQGCARFHLYVWNLATGQLYIHGEGRHVGWMNGGERINFFRLITGDDGRQLAHLYTMRPDGTDRQEIWLPGGAEYVSAQQTGLGLPWNDGGTRVMVANAGSDDVMLFNLADRAFSPPVVVPDKMPLVNRLAVLLVKGEKSYLWATIRGEFVIQNARTGDWTALSSEVASTGVAPRRVRAFATGNLALVEMADQSAYILDFDNDRLVPVRWGG